MHRAALVLQKSWEECQKFGDQTAYPVEKGMIDDADSFIEARILRNKIAHEYVEKVMTDIYQKAMSLVPSVLDSVQRVSIYVKKYETVTFS